MTRTGLAASLAALMLLGGCVSFGPKVPDTLLSLTPEAAVQAGSAASGTVAGAIVVLAPEAERRLDVQRVPVQIDAANIAYLKGAQWVERPARLMQRLMAETIRARTGKVVLENDPGVGNGVRLSSRLLEMGYDARTSSAIVRLDATREQAGGRIDSRRFESVVPGVSDKAASVGPALNRAANDVARQVAEWAG